MDIKRFYFSLRLLFGKALTDFLYFIGRKNKKLYKDLAINDIRNSFFIFNRTDLIGDAIVTLPFFLSLKKQGLKFKVLCSKYNKWVLEPFVNTEVLNVEDETSSEKLLNLINFTYLFLRKNRQKKKNFFFDLVGSRYVTKKYYKEFFCIHCKSSVTNLMLSDYIINDYYVTFGKLHLIEKYKLFFEEFGINLFIDEFPKELDGYILKNHNPEIEKLINFYKKFIIVYVGNKNYRNFSPYDWKSIIEKINYDGYILVIDDLTNYRASVLQRIVNKSNVKIINNNYDLWSLMYLAKFADWVIGIDGGGFNFLQIPTNAIGIYFYTNVNTWKPYSNNPYYNIYFDKKTKIKVIKSITSYNKKKLVIFVDEKDYIKAYYEKYKLKNRSIVNNLKNFLLNQNILGMSEKGIS